MNEKEKKQQEVQGRPADTSTQGTESQVPHGADEPDQTQSQRNTRRGATGPRSARGKAISSKNALKYRVFSGETVLDAPFFKESKNEYRRLLRRLIDEYKPVGIRELVQVELAAIQLQKYRRFLRTDQALILIRNAPGQFGMDWMHILCDETTVRTEEKTQEEHSPAKHPEDAHERFKKLSKALPTPADLEWLQKSESQILRHYYRALSELDRLREMRLGGQALMASNRVGKKKANDP